MKLENFISLAALLMLVGCTPRNKTTESAFSFNWASPQQLEVVERASKKSGTMELIHHGEFVKTNDDYVLQWHNPTITEINGERVSSSIELQAVAVQLEKAMTFPSFRISSDGEFIEAINLEEAVEKVNEMVDAVATNRPEDSRKFLAGMAKSELGKDYLNQIYGSIWQTWVEVWIGVNLADGESESVSGMVEFAGVEVLATDKTTNLGAAKNDKNLVGLKYEQELSGTNFLSGLNNFMENMAAEADIESAGPITNECTMRRVTTLEVQTERETLRPHWAKRTVKAIFAVPGEQAETEWETREYRFLWGRTNVTDMIKQP